MVENEWYIRERASSQKRKNLNGDKGTEGMKRTSRMVLLNFRRDLEPGDTGIPRPT